jgi:stage V sporulation protein D (sporulation-specific penicillin-binding protein)
LNYEVESKKRIVWLLLIVLIIMGGLILRSFYIQVFMAGRLKEAAEKQRFRALPIVPRRGAVYDRLGNELATSIDGECIYGLPAEVGMEITDLEKKQITDLKDASTLKKIAQIVGGALEMEPIQIEQVLSKRASFVWIKRRASFEEVDKLRKALSWIENGKRVEIHGIEVGQRARRFYPHTIFGSQLIGIAGIDNQGLEGLEKHYERYLAGVPGSDQAEFDTSGHYIPQGERRYLAPVDGDSLYLTIDQNIQYIVERELEKAVNDTGSKRGMGIVADPHNGEILAIASYPRFDPNEYSKYPSNSRRNPLVTDMYEPGSTFKVFTAAAALEEGKVSLDSEFFDPGFIVVDDRRIKCWKAGGHGSQTFTEAVENSCNPVFATLALRLGKDTLYKYIKAFGFGTITGIDFPGETPGRLQPFNQVKNVEVANIGFGQGVAVTPIQMVMGVSAIANGGSLLRPYLVKKIVSPGGKVVLENKRQVVREVVSKETAEIMRDLMRSVVTNGSGVRAYLDGFRVAGKTGTAQKVVQGRKGYSQLIASFIGFAPADDPRLVGMVILDEPSCPVKYGGVIAAPVVGGIFRDSLRYLGVKPVFEPQTLDKLNAEEVIVPNLLNRPIAEALAILHKNRVSYRLIGKGSFVYDQVPKPGIKIKRQSKVLIYFDPEEKYQSGKVKLLLPNLHGLSVAKVEQMLNELGLNLKALGNGIATEQHPPAGTVVESGSVINVLFKPESQ